MAKEIAVITLHGMGDTDEDYYKKLEKKLRKHVGKNKWDDKVHLEPVFYQDLLQGKQEQYWAAVNEPHSLRWDFIRKFMLFSFSDAAAIEHSLSVGKELYLDVHRRIAKGFDNSLAALGSPDKPVIVIAQSLGCEQISNYIWDAMMDLRLFSKRLERGTAIQKEFRRLSTCKMLVTTGCNIPLFKAGLDDPKLFDQPNDHFKWVNYFDKDDVLGYPMRDMSPHFKVNWLKDKKVSVGGFFTGWNPLSHTKYWTDKDVVDPIGDEIARLIP